MIEVVRFVLRVPLASWATTGHVIRTTDPTPSWSAIVGMVGAAFGWPRESDLLFRFAIEYAMALRAVKGGSRLEDYHTVQSPNAPKASLRRVRTRTEELDLVGDPPPAAGHREVNTTITRREYLADVEYEIQLVPLVASPVETPSRLVQAFATPVFPLYAGRRSCLIGRLSAECVAGELNQLVANMEIWDARLPVSRKPAIVRERRDMPLPQRRFAVRSECVA